MLLNNSHEIQANRILHEFPKELLMFVINDLEKPSRASDTSSIVGGNNPGAVNRRQVVR